MKPYLKNFAILLAFAVAVSCAKDKELVPANNVNVTPPSTTGTTTGGSTTFDPSTQTLVSQGTFKNGVHPTSGTAKLYQKGTTYTLVFDNFKTDAGPDLRIYLAEDTQAKNFIQLAELKNTGNFFLTLPDDAKVNDRKQVLIWCKQFTVLFGSAELVVPAQK
ncbi:DM13 domain-containing protein [Persicitalea sp.]|uniref:DM13 domain-containing protein n=1 Tax=Persicitalea sp. TaxID=3100273 RepID=UPI003593BB7A